MKLFQCGMEDLNDSEIEKKTSKVRFDFLTTRSQDLTQFSKLLTPKVPKQLLEDLAHKTDIFLVSSVQKIREDFEHLIVPGDESFTNEFSAGSKIHCKQWFPADSSGPIK